MLYKQLMWTAAFGIIRSWQGAFSTVIGKSSAGCLAILALGLPVHAQQLEALLASSSLNVTQTRATAPVIPMGPVYTLLTDEDRSRTDDIGYRLALAARWQLGKAGFFVQPELAFTNTRGQTYFINHYRVPQFPDRDNFSHRIHRWELAMLVGKPLLLQWYAKGDAALLAPHYLAAIALAGCIMLGSLQDAYLR